LNRAQPYRVSVEEHKKSLGLQAGRLNILPVLGRHTAKHSAALPAFQNALCTNVVAHHCRHRASVCSLTPSSARSRLARHGVTPCCIAVASTTTAPKYTRRPKKRSDAGVCRLRHVRTAQQKLNRHS